MISPFGVDHGDISKRDYTKAQEKWERAAQRANVAETAGQTIAGAGGALIGAATLREAVFRDKPELRREWAKRAKSAKTRFVPLAVHGRPGYKTLAAAIGGSAVAGVAGHSRKLAEHKSRKYERMNLAKAKAEPGSSMHARDVEIVKNMFKIDTDDANLKRHKKAQGVLGGAAATTGLAALATKTGSGLLPKMSRGGKAGAAYQKHLDRTANALLFAGAGLGGASGLHQSAIYSAEGRKQKPIGKAYDPEKRRQRQELGFEAGLAGGSAVSAGSAARTYVRRSKTRRAYNEAADSMRRKARQRASTATRLDDQAARTYKEQVAPGGMRRKPNYRKMKDVNEKRERATYARNRSHQAFAASQTLRGKAKTHLPKHPVKAMVLSGALAGGAVATHRHRKDGGRPYQSWMDGQRPKADRPKHAGPVKRYRMRRYQPLEQPNVEHGGFPTPDEQKTLAAEVERRRRRKS